MSTNKSNGQRSPDSKRKEISGRLLKERQEALKLLETQAKKTFKPTSQVTPSKCNTYLHGRKSPIGKENPSSKSTQLFSKENVRPSNSLSVPNVEYMSVRDMRYPKIKKVNQTKNVAPTKAKPGSELTNIEFMSARDYKKQASQILNEISRSSVPNDDLVDAVEHNEPRKYLGPFHDYDSAILPLDSIILPTSSMVAQEMPTPKLSFNPKEMAARSTLFKHESQTDHNQILRKRRASLLTIDDILTKSTLSNIRGRRQSSTGYTVANDRNSVVSSCISNFSAMQLNPRPTSSSSRDNGSESLGYSVNNDDEIRAANVDLNIGEESFAPAELNSRFLNDEIAWAQENLVLPDAKKLSKEARAKLAASKKADQFVNASTKSNTTMSTSITAAEMSVGQFFQLRSVDLCQMVGGTSPPPFGHEKPSVQLGDDTVTTTTSTFSTNDDDDDLDELLKTPGNKYRTYDKTVTQIVDLCEVAGKRDSKDSGNATGKSSDQGTASEKHKIQKSAPSKPQADSFQSDGVTSKATHDGELYYALKKSEQSQISVEVANLLENKENIDAFDNADNRTLSFTDSLLNTSIQSYRKSSIGQARAPLSPIPIARIEPQRGNEFGICGFENRRNRLSKSPPANKCSNTKFTELIVNDASDNEDDNAAKAALAVAADDLSNVIDKNSHLTPMKRKENDESTSGLNKNGSKTLTPTHINSNNSLGSMRTCELSPLSSPCSYLSSPRAGVFQCSPTFDRTTNSDLRFLSPTMSMQQQQPQTKTSNGGASLQRSVSSPSVNAAHNSQMSSAVVSARNCGAVPVRTYSACSVKSVESVSTRNASRCSNNSEYSHRDGGILPLKASSLELCWSSIKLHSGAQKSVQIRNTSSKRLVVRVLAYGPGFRLFNLENNLLTFAAQECRTIVVNFCPTILGPAIGKLCFRPPKALSNAAANNYSNNELIIPLYAYGGHANIFTKKIMMGPVKVPFFPIGDFADLLVRSRLIGEFHIHNQGPLLGFAFISIEQSGPLHLPGLSKAFTVEPDCVLIAPNSTATIRLTFAPNRQDLKKIKKVLDVILTLARMRIIYGDEAMRQRLRQIRQQMCDDAEKLEKHFFTDSLNKLWTQIPGETEIAGLNSYAGETILANDIWNSLSAQEAAITLANQSMQDETAAELSTIFHEADNTCIFQTTPTSPRSLNSATPLATLHEHQLEETSPSPPPAQHHQQSSNVDRVALISSTTDDNEDEAIIVNTTHHDESQSRLSVWPASVEFDFRTTQRQCVPILICNYFKTAQYFNVACNSPDVLCFTPSHGNIEPNGGQCTVVVSAHPAHVQRNSARNLPQSLNIMVYTDSAKITVPVRVPS